MTVEEAKVLVCAAYPEATWFGSALAMGGTGYLYSHDYVNPHGRYLADGLTEDRSWIEVAERVCLQLAGVKR